MRLGAPLLLELEPTQGLQLVLRLQQAGREVGELLCRLVSLPMLLLAEPLQLCLQLFGLLAGALQLRVGGLRPGAQLRQLGA